MSKIKKSYYKTMAVQLRYTAVMPDIWAKIDAAETEYEIARIMRTARNLASRRGL